MTAWIVYLVIGGAIAGIIREEGDDDKTVLMIAALWPAFTMALVVYALRQQR